MTNFKLWAYQEDLLEQNYYLRKYEEKYKKAGEKTSPNSSAPVDCVPITSSP